MKKVFFIIFLLSFPVSKLVSQINEDELIYPDKKIIQLSKLKFQNAPIRKEIISNYFLALIDRDTVVVPNDSNKSFFSIDVGWKNYPDVMTFGLSIGAYIGKNWYVVPAYCRIHPFKTKHNNFVKEGNSISTLFGISANLEKFIFIFVFGPDVYWNTSLTYGALNIGFITKLEITDTIALSINYRTHITTNLLPMAPFEHNYLSFGISCNSF